MIQDNTMVFQMLMTAPSYKMIFIWYMIGLLVRICLLMPKNSNIYNYVLVLILRHLPTYTPVLVFISLTTTCWMLRTFSSRDMLTMLTLFKALVVSRPDYGCQL